MAPQKVNERSKEEVYNNLYAKYVKPKLKVGDGVRLNKKFRAFHKGYLSGWTEEVFVIARAPPGVVLTYKLNECDGAPLRDTLNAQDLLLVFSVTPFKINQNKK